jgi:AcrR family transcriptional regulator
LPRPRFSRLEPDRRHQLLEAAGRAFAADGYSGVSLNRIIDQLGISKGAFYYYFDDKADLLAAVCERAWELMLPAQPIAIEELDRSTFWPTVLALGSHVAATAHQHPWLAGIGQILYNPPQELDDALLAQPIAAVRSWLDRLLEHGQRLGLVRTDLPRPLLVRVVAAAGEAADRWFVEQWSKLDSATLDRLEDATFATLRRIVEPPELTEAP